MEENSTFAHSVKTQFDTTVMENIMECPKPNLNLEQNWTVGKTLILEFVLYLSCANGWNIDIHSFIPKVIQGILIVFENGAH